LDAQDVTPGCREWVAGLLLTMSWGCTVSEERTSSTEPVEAVPMLAVAEALAGTWVGTNFGVGPPETLVVELSAVTRYADGYRFAYRMTSASTREDGMGSARLAGDPPALEVCPTARACAWLVVDPPDGLRLVSSQEVPAFGAAWELIKR